MLRDYNLLLELRFNLDRCLLDISFDDDSVNLFRYHTLLLDLVSDMGSRELLWSFNNYKLDGLSRTDLLCKISRVHSIFREISHCPSVFAVLKIFDCHVVLPSKVVFLSSDSVEGLTLLIDGYMRLGYIDDGAVQLSSTGFYQKMRLARALYTFGLD